MTRRAAFAGGLLAVAAVLSSCSSPSAPGSDAVASADGAELSRTTLEALVGSPLPTPGATSDTTAAPDTTVAVEVGTASAADVRIVMTEWLRAAGLGADMSGVDTRAELAARTEAAAATLAEPLLDDARATYDTGWDGSPTVCLALIPFADDADPQEIIDAMEGGMTIAEAAAQFSSEPELAASGGVVTFEDGTNCAETAKLNPAIAQQMAGALPGDPVTIALATGQGILVIRPFDELTTTEQIRVDPSVQARFDIARSEALDAADIWVDSRFGRWVAATTTVEALFAG